MLDNKFFKAGMGALALSFAVAYAPVSSAALAYSQDWESRTAGETTGVQDGWVIGNINNTTGGEWFVGFAAPTGAGAWADFVSEGGTAQGNTQLTVYTDYNDPNINTNGHNVEGFVYRDLGTITADMVGNTYAFSFDGKLGNIISGPNPTGDANAYVSILEQTVEFGTMFNDTFNYTGLPGDGTWGGGSIDVLILPEFEGELLQIGFSWEVTGVMDTGIVYDNLNFAESAVVPVPAAVWLFGSGLIGLIGVARRRKAQA